MLMMGLVFCTSLSSGMTPIAHVFPVLSMGVFKSLAGSSISYGQYMIYAIPTGIIIFAIMMLVFRFIMRPSTKELNLNSPSFDEMKKEIPKANKGEKKVLAMFIIVLILGRTTIKSFITHGYSSISTYTCSSCCTCI